MFWLVAALRGRRSLKKHKGKLQPKMNGRLQRIYVPFQTSNLDHDGTEHMISIDKVSLQGDKTGPTNQYRQLSTNPGTEQCHWKPPQPLHRKKLNTSYIRWLDTVSRRLIGLIPGNGIGMHQKMIRSSQRTTSQNISARNIDDAFDLSENRPKARCLLRSGADILQTVQYQRTPSYHTEFVHSFQFKNDIFEWCDMNFADVFTPCFLQ